jgi:Zn-dependent oligopeptidase
MRYLTLALVFTLTACGASLKTNVSPIADISNAGGKIEESGQAIFQATIKAHAATPNVVSQKATDDVALAVNKLGHAGLTLNAAITVYNAAKAAGSDLTAQKAAVNKGLDVVEQFLNDIGQALPKGTLQTVDALVNTIIDLAIQIKTGVGL